MKREWGRRRIQLYDNMQIEGRYDLTEDGGKDHENTMKRIGRTTDDDRCDSYLYSLSFMTVAILCLFHCCSTVIFLYYNLSTAYIIQ